MQKFQEQVYDLVIMDIQMPVMDGYEATAAIRQWELERQRESVPIIAMTAHTLAGTAEHALQAGCTNYITKPMRKHDFLDMVVQYLGGYEAPAGNLMQPASDMEATAVPPAVKNDLMAAVDPVLVPVVPDFLESAFDNLERIQEHANSCEYDAVKNCAHTIKGDAGTFGFKDAFMLAQKLERAAIDHDSGKIIYITTQLQLHLELISDSYHSAPEGR